MNPRKQIFTACLCALLFHFLFVGNCQKAFGQYCDPITGQCFPFKQKSWTQKPSESIKAILPNVCLVRAGNALGSGTYLADEVEGDWVLTAWHVVDGVGKEGRVTCTFSNGQTISGKVAGDHKTYDQACIRLDNAPVGIKGASLRLTDMILSEEIWIVGYRDGKLLTREGDYYGRSRPCIKCEDDLAQISVAAIQGMSGGPALDAQGNVCGAIWTSDLRTTTTITAANRTRFFLRHLFPSIAKKIQERHERILPNDDCPFCPKKPVDPNDGNDDQALTPELTEIGNRLDQLEKLITGLADKPGCDCQPQASVDEIVEKVLSALRDSQKPSVSIEDYNALVQRMNTLEAHNEELEKANIALQSGQNNLIATQEKFADALGKLNDRQTQLAETTNALLGGIKSNGEQIAALDKQAKDALKGFQIVDDDLIVGVIKPGDSVNFDIFKDN